MYNKIPNKTKKHETTVATILSKAMLATKQQVNAKTNKTAIINNG